MYLITKKLAGMPLPTSLPNSLVPPSMRTGNFDEVFLLYYHFFLQDLIFSSFCINFFRVKQVHLLIKGQQQLVINQIGCLILIHFLNRSITLIHLVHLFQIQLLSVNIILYRILLNYLNKI
jgi:hypothetical protein